MLNRQISLILIVLCFLVYSNSLNNAFVSDDIPTIVKNPLISEPFRFWYSPTTFLNSLIYLIARDNPFIYHLTNIILHSIVTILVFYLLNLFFKPLSSLLGAGLFAVHPIHAEAVTWISGRGYIDLALFILITYFLYYTSTACNAGLFAMRVCKKGLLLGRYAVCLTIFTYLILYHFTFYFLVIPLFVLSDIVFRRWRKNWIWWLPFLVIAIIRIFLAKEIIFERALQVAKDIGAKNIIWSNPLFNISYSLFSYLGLLLWPAKLTLYHEPPVITTFALRIELIILFILAICLPFIFKKAKAVFFGIGIFILFLAPTYSPVMISWLVAERYAYFPSIAFSIIACFLYEIFRGASLGDTSVIVSRNVPTMVFIFIIAAYAVRTVARNEDWKTPERFWRQTVLVSPFSPRAHNNMGDIYSQEGNIEGAIREFKKAIELKPDYADAHHNLGNTYYTKGDIVEAIKYYQKALAFNPDLFESHYNLGIIYLNKKEWNLAIGHLERALKIRPDSIDARNALNLAISKSSN